MKVYYLSDTFYLMKEQVLPSSCYWHGTALAGQKH